MFKEILEHIDFDNNEALLFVNQKDEEDIGEIRRKILYLAQDDYFADAVFFQKKGNNKYIPQFFLFDNTTNNKYNSVKLSDIHKRLWSSGIVPLYFVLEKERIKIYNTKEKVNINNEEEEEINPTDILEISNIIEAKYQSKKDFYTPFLFQNGSFWETEYYIKNYLKTAITKESPFDILISNLHELKKDLIQNIDNNLSEDLSRKLLNFLPDTKSLNQNDNLKEDFLIKTANRIVVFSILIKYLEEKKDKNNNSVFTVKGNLFKKKWNVEDYSELIKEGKFSELLNYLSERFNGKIFELTKAEEFLIKNLPEKSLNHLSHFVNADYKNKNTQLYLWRLYSFQFLPVELISRIYEEFIPDTAGVVYTPPFLVDLLVDECMPLDGYESFNNNKFKVIDPACGSGIFCVSAYQRLIDWHIINEYKKTKTWNKGLKIETLKNILSENIFGVDKEQEAVNIAVFSLTLALLEKLTPKQLWEDLDFEDTITNKSKKLKNLKEKNIKYDNFFNYLKTADNDFDLVIGNPPFIRQNFKKLEKDYNLEIPTEIPANLSILFLDQSIKLLKDNGLQCLILPSSNILYNDGVMKYRSHFLKKYTVPQIIDFTHLRETLFKSGKKKNKGRIATCAFFAKKQIPKKDNQILHLISHRTSNEENKMFFVFDTYDFHFIPLNIALSQKYIWKSNLVGGGRLNWMVNRLSEAKPTFEDYISNKENSNDWAYKEGYKVAKKLHPAKYITDKYFIPEKFITEKGIDYSKIKIEKAEKFEGISIEKVFTKNQIIIKKIVTNNGVIPIEIIDYNEVEKYQTERLDDAKNRLCFKNGLVGIHFNENDEGIAKEIVENFRYRNNKIYSLICVLTSGAMLIRKETLIVKKDIDNLPYPQTNEDKQSLQLSKVEEIWQDDIFNYYIHQGKSSKNNPSNKIANKELLINYADAFTWLMNLNYNSNKEKRFKTEKITITKSYVAIEFHYSKEDSEIFFDEKTEEEYLNYFEKQIGRNKKITRIVEFIDFKNNKIYYIKPLQNRYWLKSIADRDAMKCFADFGNNIFKSQR